MKLIKVGTRGSRLAIAQTQIILDQLSKFYPDVKYEIVKIVTSGDLDKQHPLFSMDRKGIFEKELDESVLNNKVDFAIHSIKDVPTNIHTNLTISTIPKRESIKDVLISKKKMKLNNLPQGSVVGTSSLRRAIQLVLLRKDLKVKPIRGNIDTRIEKISKGEYDAIILAEAGLKRLAKTDVVSQVLGLNEFLPAPGQGALAIVCKKTNKNLIKFLSVLEHEPSRKSIEVERMFISKIGGGCRFPIGAYAISSKQNNNIKFFAKVFSADGSTQLFFNFDGKYNSPKSLGTRAAKYFVKKGAIKLAQGWDQAVIEWNKKVN
ncbi:MAG: hydroxymethylbilane synthase [Nitrososphaeraceae archaeon]|nr:hydroxymethylbilane synthase [Nitrososphaeraceae archaeon]